MAEHSKTQYLLNNGVYHNIPTLLSVSTDKEFRLDPRSLSLASLLGMNSLFAAVFLGVFAFAYSRNPSLACYAVLAVWLVTAVSYTLFVTVIHHKSEREGPAFIYCRQTGKIELPRHNESFGPDDEFWFESLTAKTKGDKYGDSCSELNFACKIDGKTHRWNIVVDCDDESVRWFGKINSARNWNCRSPDRWITMCCTRSPACVRVLKLRPPSGLGEH